MSQAILVVGGYNSLWPGYLKMARELEDTSGLRAVGVPLLPWDWWSAQRAQDASTLLRKLAETVDWARRRWRARRFVLVGHSAGGLLGRLYLGDEPVWGRTYGGHEFVSALITLGTPHDWHRVPGEDGAGSRWYLVETADRLVPGSAYARSVRYWAVAGRRERGALEGNYRQRRAYRTYRAMAGEGDTWGDGVVPVSCALLEGAEARVLEGVSHSAKYGRDWYGGSAAVIRRWWPAEAVHA